MMSSSTVGMHKTILPSASGHTPPPPHQQQQQQQRPLVSYYPTQNTWQQPPAQFGQQFTMAVPPLQQGTAMMNYVGQFPLSAMTPQQQIPQQQQPNQFSFPPFQQFGQF